MTDGIFIFPHRCGLMAFGQWIFIVLQRVGKWDMNVGIVVGIQLIIQAILPTEIQLIQLQ